MDKDYEVKGEQLKYTEIKSKPVLNLTHFSKFVENKNLINYHHCEEVGKEFFADETKLQQIIDDAIEILAHNPPKLQEFLELILPLQKNFRDYRRTIKSEIVEEPPEYDLRLLGIKPKSAEKALVEVPDKEIKDLQNEIIK